MPEAFARQAKFGAVPSGHDITKVDRLLGNVDEVPAF